MLPMPYGLPPRIVIIENQKCSLARDANGCRSRMAARGPFTSPEQVRGPLAVVG